MIYALSDALDLVGIDDVAHGKRVGIMSASCGQMFGFDEEKTNFLFDLGMLHDIGVSSTRVHGHLVEEFDWRESQQHCEIGYKLLRGFSFLSAMAEPILFHHTRWSLLTEIPELDSETALVANLVFLTDRVDTLAAPFYANNAILFQAPVLRDRIAKCSGTYFAPKLVEAFLAASESEAFWLQLESRAVQARLQQKLNDGRRIYKASMSDLEQLARIFARIVDAKSSFTANHSFGVARLACLLGKRMGIGDENCRKLRISGLLHDLGKLRVPDEILDKPGPLNEQERAVINAHSFETYQILSQIKGLGDIAQWAAYHHEAPGGTGYPFHLHGENLDIEARILRVADIFQAIVQDRPYRKGMSMGAVGGFLKDLVAKGSVDGEVTDAALANIPDAMQAACL